jgi:uncharacterized protein
MPNYVTFILIGLAAGVCSGMFGIGGGVVIVPALLLATSMDVRDATGTSLAALIPPVGLLGAAEYYRADHINVKAAAIIAAGLFIGAYFGSRIMLSIPSGPAKKVYAVFLLVLAIRMLLK